MSAVLDILQSILDTFLSSLNFGELLTSIHVDMTFMLVVLAGAILLLILPHKILSAITSIFSLKEFGMHYSKWKRDNIDDLGRLFMFLSLVFCLCFAFVPKYQIVYSVILTIAFLCTLGQACRVTKEDKMIKKKLVILGVWCMFSIGIMGAIGLTNGNAFKPYMKFVMPIITEKKYLDPYFYFTDPTFAMIVLQVIILFVPLYCMWAQFIYMRLEDTYKARWMVTWILKIVICCSIMFAVPYYGFDGVKAVYNIKEEEA